MNLVLALFLLAGFGQQPQADRTIRLEKVVKGSVDDVWKTWTTQEGIASFFAPASRVEAKVDGAYEMYFAPDQPPGNRGGDGNRILAFDPGKMLSFSWNAPPSLPEARKQRTHVVVRLKTVPGGTLVSLTHDGWGEGGEWDKAYSYFSNAWRWVLGMLEYRFEKGPVDWKNLPEIKLDNQ
jgi:uncharacterized protein YndB with AHSA1/START domain